MKGLGTGDMRGFFFSGLTVVAALTAVITTPTPLARAGVVKGTIALPADAKTGRRFQGYWRLENGIVPVSPPAARGETVVILVGPKGTPPTAKTVSVEIVGLQANPATVIVGEGSVVEFKNDDRTPHDLSLPDQTALMPLERLNPSAVRRVKFQVAGAYAVKCMENPHLVISVLVVASPFFAVADEKGAFRLPDVPDGKATLKVWSHGRWVHEEELEVGPKTSDLSITVTSKNATTKGAAE